MCPLLSVGRVREMTASVGVSICSVLGVDSSAKSLVSQFPAASTRGAVIPQINVQIRSSDKQLRECEQRLSNVAELRIDHAPAVWKGVERRVFDIDASLSGS